MNYLYGRLQTMENKLTNEEINLFNKNFTVRETYDIKYIDEVPELPNDFYQEKYLNDLDFDTDRINSEVLDDSGRYYIYSKSSGEEYIIDDISDITEFIRDKMPQILERETLDKKTKPRQITFSNSENTKAKDYQKVTQI